MASSFWLARGLAVVMACAALLGSSRSSATDPVEELESARRLYVPADAIDVVVQRDRQGVVLRQAEFQKLLTLARENALQSPSPDVSLVLASSTYDARIVGDQLLLTVTAEFHQFAAGWQSLPIPLQRLSIEQALLDDQAALIGRNAEGSASVFSSTRGKHVLKLELSTEIASQGSDQVMAFSLLRAPTGTLNLTLPAGKRLFVGALQLERPAPLEQAADYRVPVGGASSLQLRVTDRATENAADALTFATTGYGLHVAPGEVTWHALTTLQVFGKPVDRLTFTVPSELEIAEVDATGLERWELSDDPADGKQTRLTLNFGQAFDGSRKISLKGVMPIETGVPWSVPPLSIANVTSHIGQILVQHPAGIRLRIEETVGIRRATDGQKTTTEMPDEMARMNATEFLRFDVWQPDFLLRLTTQPKQREVQSAVAAVLDVNATGLDLLALLTVKTQFASLFEVDVRLPADWTVREAFRDQTPLTWQVLSQEPGINQLRILLDTPLPAEASTVVRLSLHRDVEGWPVDAEPITVELPELYLPQSSLSEGTLVIRGDADLELAADLTGLDTVPLKADFERLRFETQDTRYGGKLRITRKPSRVSVQSTTFSRLDPQTTHAWIQSLVEIQGGGVLSLRVGLPESAGTALRFQSDGRQIVEQKPGPVQNGERIWTLQFDQRLRGVIPLTCDIELPRGGVSTFEVPQIRFPDAERQSGFHAVEAGGEQRLTIEARSADGTPLNEVDPLNLPATAYEPAERIVAVFQTVSAGARLTLSEERFEKLPVPTAICPLLTVTSILGQTGEVQHRAEFQLTAAGVQGLRVTLPAQTLLWATLVDGQPVEVRRQGDIYLVPLHGPTDASTPPGGLRILKLFYRSEIPALTRFGTIEQLAPELAVQTGSGASQPVDVLDQRWNLHYPKRTLLVDSTGPLEPEQHLDSTGILGQLKTGVRVPSLELLARQAFLVIVTLGTLALIVMAYRTRRLLRLIGMVVVGGILIGFLLLLNSRSLSRFDTAMAPAPTSPASMDFGSATPPPPMAAETSAVTSPMRPMSELADSEREVPADKPTADFDGAKKEMKDQRQVDDFADLAQQAPAQQGQAQPQQPPAPAIPQPAKPTPASAQTQLARLSLAIDLVPPDESYQKSFRYLGAESARNAVTLQLEYLDEQSGTVARVALISLVVLIGWLLRKSSCAVRTTLAAAGLTLPLALIPVVPDLMQVALDGVFFGMVIVCGLWLMSGLVRCCAGCCVRRAPATVPLTALLVSVLMARSVEAQSDKTAAPAQGTPSPVSLVVPFEGEPLASDRILLPYDKFAALYARAYPDRVPAGAPPLAGGVVEALYRVKIVPNDAAPDESTAVVTARYVLRSTAPGQMSFELPVGAVAWRDAKLNGEAAALRVEGACTRVVVMKPGLHVLDAGFAVPVRLSGATGTLSLPLQPVPSGKLALELPARDLSVRINGSTTVFRRVVQGELAIVEMPIDKGGDLVVGWQPEQARGAAAAVIHVDSVQAVILTDAGVRISAGYLYRVRQGSIADVTLTLPGTVRLQAVTGPDVGGWELQGDGDARKLRIIFRRNVTDTTQLTVEAFVDSRVGAEATTLSVPQLAPLEITNEIGQVAVFAGDQFTIRAESVDALSQVDSDKFSTTVPFSRPAVPPQLAYRFSRRPFSLSLRAVRQESQAVVLAHQAAFVTIRKQQLTTRLRYNLTGAPRSSFQIALPENFVVLDVKATGLQDWSTSPGESGATLTIDLNAPRLGAAEVILTGMVPRDPAELNVPLQFPQPLDATRLNSTVAVWLDDGFTGTLENLDGWRSVDAGSISGELKSVRPEAPVQFAFVSTAREPAPISLQLSRAIPRLTANGLAMVSVTDVAVVHSLALQWNIQAATTDMLVFSTPSFLAGKLEFTGPGIRETTHVDAGNGRTRWTIWLRAPIQGPYFVGAVGTLPSPATEVEAPALVFERSDGAPGVALENQRQYVLLVNLSQSQLTSATPELTEPVTREDVPVVVDQSLVDQATEFVRVKQLLTAPRWTLQKFSQTAGAPASVNVADLTTILSRDGTYRGQAIYTIKNRSRQFLALQMPENAEILSVFVGTEPSRAVTTTRNNQVYQLVALPKTSVASLSFPVRILWSGRIPAALPRSARILSQEIDLPSPRVVSQQDDPDFGIPVARTRWTVWLPKDLDARPLRDGARQNLGLVESGQSDLLYERAAIQELSELMGYVEQNYSFRSTSEQSRRSQLRNNLKQIGLALHNMQQLESTVRNVRGDAEFQQQRDGALRGLSDLQKSVQEDALQVTTSGAQGGQNVEGLTEQATNGSLGTNGLSVLSNTVRLYEGNSGNGIQIQDRKSGEFGFQLGIQDESAGEKSGGKTPSKGDAKPQSKGIETREQFRRDNAGNVDTLNEALNRQKANDYQSRAAIIQGQPNGQPENGAPEGRSSRTRGGGSASGTVNPYALSGNLWSNSANPANTPMAAPGAMGGMGGFGVSSGIAVQGGGQALGLDVNGIADPFQVPQVQQFAGEELAQAVDGLAAVVALDETRRTPPSGLSLGFDLPADGKQLVFSKVGGDARLALAVRPRESIRWGLNLTWSVLWLLIGAAFITAANSQAMGSRVRRQLPVVMAVLGVAGFVLLPGLLSGLAFVVFVLAAIVVAWINRHAPQA